MCRWRDGSQLASGDRVAEIRLGADRREAGAQVQVTHHHINRPPVPRKNPRPDWPF